MEIGDVMLPPEMLTAIASSIRSMRAVLAFSLVCTTTNAAVKHTYFWKEYLSLNRAERSEFVWVINFLEMAAWHAPFAPAVLTRIDLKKMHVNKENYNNVVSFEYPNRLFAFWDDKKIEHHFLDFGSTNGVKLYELRSFAVRPPLLCHHIPCYIKDRRKQKKASHIVFHLKCNYYELKGGTIYALRCNVDGVPALAPYDPIEDI